jgi:hypothetical protein
MKLETAHCATVLADGSVATISASRRPRDGRADIKCAVTGNAALASRMQQVARLARHTEATFDSRDQVVLSIDRLPLDGERDWELAVVLADRLVRGKWQHAGVPVANGWSGSWETGRIDGRDLKVTRPGMLLGGFDELPHLGALNGLPDPISAVSTARTWFPLHSGGVHDCLCWVEVSVHPLDGAGPEEEETIAVVGADAARQHAVRLALAGSRLFDGRGLGRWRTLVRFGQQQFQGESYQLALVMADRLARGREFPARGRLIATGTSPAWHTGEVAQVDGREPKSALLAKEALAGDRILLPAAWESGTLDAALRDKGASVAWVSRIGII